MNWFPAILPLACAAVVGAQGVEDEFYKIDTFPDRGLRLEIGALAKLSDGRIMLGTRTGDLFIAEGAYEDDPEKVVYKIFARGLAQPLGLLEHEGWIYTAQRGELTRMKDSDGDGRADQFLTVCDDWQISGNYHEYNFGPRLDKDGKLWVTLNKPFGGQPYGRAHWRGWAVRVDPATGKMEPMATGLRSPAGVESSPEGEIFYTDNQGEWCNASKLSHLSHGEFHGHPHGLPSIELAGEPFSKIPSPKSGTLMKDLHETVPQFKMPAVWFPYNKMGKSPSGMAWDTSGGKFGPFEGQLFVADQHHATVMRVFLEKIDGHWQGACFRFREGFQCGIIRIAFGKDASLFVGMSNAGWGGRGNKPYGFQRLRWTGAVPFEVHSMKARPDGFLLTFTNAVDPVAAAEVANYTLESYTYKLESRYGGPEVDKKQVVVKSAQVVDDGKAVRLVLEEMRAGYLHELRMQNLASKDGAKLLHPEAYYTLVKIPK
jgi:glucose/arabinose dehydrogenase